MKSKVVCWVLGLGAAIGCGGGVDGARGDGDAGSASSTSMGGASLTAGTGGAPVGVAGSPAAGDASAAGTPALGGMGGGGSGSKPCGPEWKAGTSYATGAIVQYQGGYYIAEHENPGYDPVISSYFWDPYSCPTAGNGSGGSTIGTGGTGPLGDSAFDDVVSEALFNQLFPDRNQFYTYQGLIDATRHYPLFAGAGSPDQRKREAAAFLANVSRETGELIYIDQIEKDVYCQPSAKCPCEPGKLYYGRGPIQISWNYNYCSAGTALGIDLRAQPELVSQNATIAWETGLWFWMTQRGAGTMTPHDAMVGDKGFGETIRSINGTIECQGNGSTEGVMSRVGFYLRICQIMGVSPGENQTC
jgi:predicted chitinase